jgi:hypothetical protein
MSNYGNNMPPSATMGAYSNMAMPVYGMQSNAAPAYTSPAFYGPANVSPYPMGYSPMWYGPKHPVYTAAAVYGAASPTGMILVLFILLVIIGRTCL